MLLLRLPPAVLASVLGVGPELSGRLRNAVSSRSRLTAAIRTRLGELPDSLSIVQARLLDLDVESLEALAYSVGAVWHAALVTRLVDGVAVRSFVGKLGAPAFEAALRFRPLAPVEAISARWDPLDGSELAIRAERSGRACLHAWCDVQPTGIGIRVRLLLPGVEEPDAAERIAGPALVEGIVANAP